MSQNHRTVRVGRDVLLEATSTSPIFHSLSILLLTKLWCNLFLSREKFLSITFMHSIRRERRVASSETETSDPLQDVLLSEHTHCSTFRCFR